MKPQERVVTAQDVQSCLYYVHKDSPNDYELLRDHDCSEKLAVEDHSPYLSSSDSPATRRKALPQNPSLGSDIGPNQRPDALHSRARSSGWEDGAHGRRKPVNQGLGFGNRGQVLPPRPQSRTLLGPRDMNQHPHSVDSFAIQSPPERQNVEMRRWSKKPAIKPPRLPPRLNSTHGAKNSPLPRGGNGGGKGDLNNNHMMRERKDPGAEAIPAEHCWEWEKSWETKRASAACTEEDEVNQPWQGSEETHREKSTPTQLASLSLIRRYGGEQWNVAKIMNIGQSDTTRATPDIISRAYVDILTPGYSKFIDADNSEAMSLLVGTSKQATGVHYERQVIFRRHLQLSRDVKPLKEWHTPDLKESRFAAEEVWPEFESRQQSSNSFRTSMNEASAHKPELSRGYTIESPWNGVCEFSTGIAGRSLKCKHSYSSTNTQFGPGLFSTAVSELRFNLPSSKALGKPDAKSADPGAPRERNRSSMFLRSHHRRTSSPFEPVARDSTKGIGGKIELADRLDLSLGQEHAGGGFGGKQAKLGKLIIEVGGLQMLDLVVAANMALWWRVYEKMT